MTRRETLRNLVATTGALVALPSWAQSWTKAEVIVHASTFTPSEQLLVTSIADTIIPASNSIGALSVGVDKFLLKLFDVCYEPETQENIKKQLASIDSTAQKEYSKSFTQCDQPIREKILLTFDQSADATEKGFFKIMKSETIRGFNTSKEVMTNYLKYKSAPGHYYGCVDLKA
jgi:hypothetical protein